LIPLNEKCGFQFTNLLTTRKAAVLIPYAEHQVATAEFPQWSSPQLVSAISSQKWNLRLLAFDKASIRPYFQEQQADLDGLKNLGNAEVGSEIPSISLADVLMPQV
jgi:hypothetical protein